MVIILVSSLSSFFSSFRGYLLSHAAGNALRSVGGKRKGRIGDRRGGKATGGGEGEGVDLSG